MSDLVERDAVIDAIERVRNNHAYDEIEEIQKLPSVTPSRPMWIPVSERLPEEYGEYLITWKNPKYPKTYIGICECEITDVYDHEHNRFEVEWLFDGYITTAYPDSYVVAWQPLPEPYQKGGKE